MAKKPSKLTSTRKKGAVAAARKGKDPRGDSFDSWLGDEEAVALPDYGIPELRTKAKKRRRLSRLLQASVWTGPLAAVLAFGALGLSAQAASRVNSLDTAPPPQIQVQEITSPGRFAATQALETWLVTVPNPLPGGRLVSWDGATDGGVRSAGAAAGGQLVVTHEHFTVVDGTGTSYRVTYQVGSDAVGGGSAVLAGPSLQARPQPAAGLTVDALWPGLRKADVTPQIQEAVQTWADAYVSGVPDRLHLVVGDTDADRTYVPISGATHVLTDAKMAGRTDALPTVSTEDTPAERLIVRAELRVGWEGRDSEPSPAVIQMDLLVLRADTGAPQVVAWGAPGTGPELTPYVNAVPKMNREAAGVTGPRSGSEYDDSGTAPEDAVIDDGLPTEGSEDAGDPADPSAPTD